MDISKIDTNLASVSVDGAEIEWISSRDEVFSLHGIFFNEEEKLYMRVPPEVTKATLNPSLHSLTRTTAGGRIRFVTDSKYISIKASLPAFRPLQHMPITMTHGFTVYADGFFRNRYSPVFKDFLEIKGEWYEDRIIFSERKIIQDNNKKRVIDIYFPLYGGVSELYIGVDPDSVVEKAPPHKIKKPLLFYGSSITQGACVTRPGNDYISVLARKLDADYINLGFSGNGNSEDAMIDYITSIDASLYAFDYNMYPNKKDRILPPHFSIYERIRKKHPDAVILLYDKPGCDYEPYPEREQIIYDTYKKALELGDKKVLYISAWDLFGEGDRDCCMVDVSHPSDLGAMRMADVIYKTIAELL